jgi:hypothetical protein
MESLVFYPTDGPHAHHKVVVWMKPHALMLVLECQEEACNHADWLAPVSRAIAQGAAIQEEHRQLLARVG